MNIMRTICDFSLDFTAMSQKPGINLEGILKKSLRWLTSKDVQG
jgi:hypothetical protein